MSAADTSAIVALAMKEREAEDFRGIILKHRCILGAPTVLACQLVLRLGRASRTSESFRAFIRRPRVRVEAFTQALYQLAAAAFDRYGKGREHPAQLNLGDCMAYAAAMAHDIPSLFKGNDFAQTDIVSALP